MIILYQAPEQIPIYSLSTSRTYREKSIDRQDDWTGNSDKDIDEDD